MESQETPIYEKYWQVLKRRYLPALGIFVPVFAISVFSSSLKKSPYVAEGTLLFQSSNTISSLTGVGTEIGKLESLVQDKGSPIHTEAEVIRSLPIVEKTIDRVKLKDKTGTLIKPKGFLSRLTVVEIPKTDILKVSYTDTHPKTASQVVNTVMAIYLEQNLLSHRAEASAARKFLEKQLPNAEMILRKIEIELRLFHEQNNIIALEPEASQSVETIANLQQQINSIKSRIADVKAQSQAIRQQLGMNPEDAVIMTSLSQSPGVQDILKEIQQLESQLADRRIILQESHPEIINLEQKLESLKAILQQRLKQVIGTTQLKQNSNLQVGSLQQQLTAKLVELESTRRGLDSELSTLTNIEANYRERQTNLPKLQQRQRQLERKLQAAQSTYSLLLQKLQESRIAENQNLGNASIISEAKVPEEPISSPIVSYLSAGLLGILASLATVYFLEATDKLIKTVDEAKELVGLTLLGVIPSFSKSKKYIRGNQDSESYTQQLIVKDIPRSPISEAFRMLRANLKFMKADRDLKVLVVTSSIPREGKSTVAANLALAMAQMERNVLLIDADLHHPVQHKIWELRNNRGLSNVIIGQADSRTAIKKVMDNLYVLPSGVVPPSPASLLDSKRMASLIDKFGVTYDSVIIDAPSLTVAADAAILGQMADGVLLVVRPGMVDSVNATLAKELLEKSGQKILGQVVNGVIPKNDRYSYYFREEYYQEEMANQNEVAKTNLKQIQMTNDK
ncbi:lipopolysaccharide biosynthesis protein [Scytonema hofmannii PCC 7110]|uniref:non-specific protein-tyrosine kinase n=1 Tax=Scytonema hofmannii PCC 7110 TaxID=128403 RepID=A0A139X648_9CYAN|nr:polysaccharide biosynthesis tyrosine autokinase [Scytonema hofmannii]KYC40113.1 lipopolysaccharide biosynthesis protein [Scytonema hofmannii PCC 7110]